MVELSGYGYQYCAVLDRHLARIAHRCFVGRRVAFAAVALHGGSMAL